MQEKETLQHQGSGIISFQGATINNLVINGFMTKNGNDHYYYQDSEERPVFSDQQVARALERIVGKGKVIDTKQKWVGAIWYLRWVCNYPMSLKNACDKINSLPFGHELEIGCDYNNLRPFSTLPFLNDNPDHLDAIRYSKNDELIYHQSRSVVIALKQELQNMKSSEIGI